MVDLTSVGVTSGVPSSGTGDVATINYLTQVGAPISNGSTSAPVTVAITGAASAVTSTMSALVTTLSPNSSARTVTLSSNPTVILSSNPTIASVSSGATTIIFGSNVAVVTGDSSLPTSSMPALLVAMSPNGINANGQTTKANSAPVTLASDQTFAAGGMPVTISSSVNLANVVAGSSAVTSTMAALVVALSTLGASAGSGSTTVGLSSAIALSSGTVTLSSARNFLWQAGSSFSGILSPSLTLMSTEAVSLASSGTATSASVFTSSMTGQSIWSEMFVTLTTTATTIAGANIAGWFLTTPSTGDTTIESTAAGVIPRAPDFIIPLPVATLGSSTTYKANGLVRTPALNFKTTIQNNAGIVLPSSASGNPSLLLVPIAEQY